LLRIGLRCRTSQRDLHGANGDFEAGERCGEDKSGGSKQSRTGQNRLDRVHASGVAALTSATAVAVRSRRLLVHARVRTEHTSATSGARWWWQVTPARLRGDEGMACGDNAGGRKWEKQAMRHDQSQVCSSKVNVLRSAERQMRVASG
jgi:hypothetical protein